MTDTERNEGTDTRRRPVGRREILNGHEGHAVGNGVAAVRGVECSCGARFDSWEEFGRHVDGLLAEPPHTPMAAVRNALADHLGDPYTQDDWDPHLEPYIDDHGRFRCGCGWESSTPGHRRMAHPPGRRDTGRTRKGQTGRQGRRYGRKAVTARLIVHRPA